MAKQEDPKLKKASRQLRAEFYEREETPKRREVNERFRALGRKVGAHIVTINSEDEIPSFSSDEEAREFWTTHKLGPGVPTQVVDLAADTAEALEELHSGGGRDLDELLEEARAKEKGMPTINSLNEISNQDDK